MVQNKTSKYFKYAIGEIILVVIGILIALQVNNWNENRKSQKEQNILIASIKQDLKADAIMLKDLLKAIDSSQNELKIQSERIGEATYTLDSLVHFARYDLSPYLTIFNGFNDNAYASAKSSGKLEIIKNDLKRELFELYVFQNKCKSEYKFYYDFHLNEIGNLRAFYPLPVDITFIKKGAANELIWENINKLDLARKLNSWGTSKNNHYRIMMRNFSNALKKTEALLKSIKEKT